MKKILFATTALVATAGYAAADVDVSGFAEMGIYGGDGIETQFHTDIDVTFTMSGEADNGLTFGASIDLDESDGGDSVCTITETAVAGTVHTCAINGDSDAFDANRQGGETIFVAYGNARLTMGDTDGAFDAALTEVAVGGSIQDDHTAHLGYNGNAGLDGTYDGQIATFSYAFSGFTGYLSAEMDDTGVGDPVWGLGVKYSAELASLTIGVGLGYQQVDVNGGAAGGDASIWGISLDTTFNNGLKAIVNYSELDLGTGNNQTHTAIGFGYTMNALTIGLNWGQYNDVLGISGVDSDGYGLAVNYDLGGGLVAQMGYGNSTLSIGGASASADTWSLGLAMSF